MSKQSKAKIVKIEGHFDASAQKKTASEITALRNKGAKRIILDLRKVEYITSSGFSAIIDEWNELRSAGGDLVIVKPPKNINIIFKVLEVGETITMLDSLSAAYRYFDTLASLPEPEPADGNEPDALPDLSPHINNSDEKN